MLKLLKKVLLILLMPLILIATALVGYYAIKEPPAETQPPHEGEDDFVWRGTLNN